MQLYIGNKNYSSWSLRAWVLMRQCAVPFDEVKLRLSFDPASEFKRRIAQISPAGRVPVLVHDDLVVWDTLAITEYLAEQHPQAGIWPADARQRARARSLCAEMHSGFGSLRGLCPMNIEADLSAVGRRLWDEHAALRADVARVQEIWTQSLTDSGGPMLFGGFSAADAFFAPVCTRIRSYGLPVSDIARAYIDRVYSLPAMRDWVTQALAEHDFLAEDEPYRAHR